MALLLGMASAERGTMNNVRAAASSPRLSCDAHVPYQVVSKMLCLHIPALLPAGFAEMEIPIVMQSAALLGVGLLYQGTAHRLMTEVLLAEIGRRPGSESVGACRCWAAGLRLLS